MTRIRVACAALLFGMGCAGVAQAQSSNASPAWGGSSDTWRFSLTPYIWLPTINAKIQYELPPGGIGGGIGGGGGGIGGGGGSGGSGIGDGLIATEIGPNQYLTKLNFALMLNGEARRGPWSVMVDYIGVRASGTGSVLTDVTVGGNRLPNIGSGAVVDTGSTTKIKTALWNVVGGYTIAHSPALHVDAIAGARFGRLEANFDWSLSATVTLPNNTPVLGRTGSIEASRNPFDGIVGLRGRYRFDDNWSMPYYVDVGAGTSKFTWQALLGVAYTFGWGDVVLSYRHLNLQDDNNEVFRKFTLSGPSIGATFRF